MSVGAFESERLVMAPLVPDDAEELVGVLGDEALHEFIGGRPATLEELRTTYERLVAGSPRPGEEWCNWVLRRRDDGRAVGTLQATLAGDVAEVAWVVGVDSQGQGWASEAATALVERLLAGGVTEVRANIHPDHRASEVVATRAGLLPTDEVVDGERIWRSSG